ncbi:MAG: thioredoxin domain-containing protein [Polyangiaceae bacterium]|nr:thioredoxin domain-containing protein [Polyangiaceae bacterium]
MFAWGLFVSGAIAFAACDRGGADLPIDKETDPQPAAHAPTKTVSPAERVPLLGARLKGSDSALVTIVELSDYECPYCKKAHATVEKLLAEYKGKVRLAVFENPLPFHSHAKTAAKWLFAAGEQGKYWEARSALFDHQNRLDPTGLADLGSQLDLDASKLDSDMNSRSADSYVQTGMDAAKTLGVQGTPTFFINGVRLIGAQPESAFRKAIDSALGQAQTLLNRGVKPENVYAEILKTAAPPGKVKTEDPAGGCDDPAARGCDPGAFDDAPCGEDK